MNFIWRIANTNNFNGKSKSLWCEQIIQMLINFAVHLRVYKFKVNTKKYMYKNLADSYRKILHRKKTDFEISRCFGISLTNVNAFTRALLRHLQFTFFLYHSTSPPLPSSPPVTIMYIYHRHVCHTRCHRHHHASHFFSLPVSLK